MADKKPIYRFLGKDVVEVLFRENGKEYIINKTLPLRRTIEGYERMAKRCLQDKI